jgi:hypothetical protein
MKLFCLKLVAFLGGAFCCFCLQKTFLVSGVLSAAITGLLGSYLHFPKLYEKKGLHGTIYSGSFAAMSTSAVVQEPSHLLLLCLICTVFYLVSKPHLNGFGGKLGTVAFLSSIVFFLGRSAW